MDSQNYYLMYRDGRYDWVRAERMGRYLCDAATQSLIVDRSLWTEAERERLHDSLRDLTKARLAATVAVARTEMAKVSAPGVARDLLARHYKKHFYRLSLTLRHEQVGAALKRGLMRAPCQEDPLVKLIYGRKVFTEQDYFWLSRHSRGLEGLGRGVMLGALRHTETPSLRCAPPEPMDPLMVLKAFDGVSPGLEMLYKLCGNADRFTDLIQRRAKQANQSFLEQARSIKYDSQPLVLPTHGNYWVKRLFDQARMPVAPERDLLTKLPEWSAAEQWCAGHGINMGNYSLSKLMPIVFPIDHGSELVPGDDQETLLRGYAKKWRWSAEIKEAAREILKWVCPRSTIPMVDMDGEAFGVPDVRLMTLPKNHPLNLAAGAYVGSCSHMGNTRTLAAATVKDLDFATVVICPKNDLRIPLARMLVYRGLSVQTNQSVLVINTWNATSSFLDHLWTIHDASGVEHVIRTYAVAAMRAAPTMAAVHIGQSKRSWPHFRVVSPARPVQFNRYIDALYDSDRQSLVL